MLPGTNIWARPLADRSWAVVLVNTHANATLVECGPACLAAMNLSVFRARDLWRHAWLGAFQGSFSSTVPGNGASAVFRFVPQTH